MKRGYIVMCYAGNDEINSQAGKEVIERYAEGNQVVFRNPAFYGGEVETLGAKNQKPDVVLIQKSAPNAEAIAQNYRAARIEVEFIEITVPRPRGVIEPAPGGDLLAFLQGQLTAKNEANDTSGAGADSKPGSAEGGKSGKGSGSKQG